MFNSRMVKVYIIKDRPYSQKKITRTEAGFFIQNNLTAQGYHLHRYRKSFRYICIIKTVAQ